LTNVSIVLLSYYWSLYLSGLALLRGRLGPYYICRTTVLEPRGGARAVRRPAARGGSAPPRPPEIIAEMSNENEYESPSQTV
jgi:hypothetical protein